MRGKKVTQAVVGKRKNAGEGCEGLGDVGKKGHHAEEDNCGGEGDVAVVVMQPRQRP